LVVFKVPQDNCLWADFNYVALLMGVSMPKIRLKS
jgi:hypothetical protein